MGTQPWAVILAGGSGTRIKSVWQGLKCLYPVNGVPLLDHIVARCIGCRICVNINAEDLPALRDSSSFNPKWELLVETERQGNGVAIVKFLKQFQPQQATYVQ